MHGTLISLKASRIKKGNFCSNSLIQPLEELDRKHKASLDLATQEEMVWVTNIVKLLDAKVVAKDVMYT